MIRGKDIGNNIVLLDATWFGNVGFVSARDTVTGDTKFYIGIGVGSDEIEDATHIAQYGTKVNPNYITTFIERSKQL